MAIAHQAPHLVTTKLASGSGPGWVVVYAVVATVVIAASMYFAFHGQGFAALDPSQIIGP